MVHGESPTWAPRFPLFCVFTDALTPRGGRQIQEGDFCDKVSVYFGISLKMLYFLNPELDAQCSNLVLGVA